MKSDPRDLIHKLLRLAKEEGQDLVEYCLLFSLIALAATAGVASIATSINKVFSATGSTLTSSIS